MFEQFVRKFQPVRRSYRWLVVPCRIQVAMVCGFIAEKQRFEVELLQPAEREKKSIQPRNLQQLQIEEEVGLLVLQPDLPCVF